MKRIRAALGAAAVLALAGCDRAQNPGEGSSVETTVTERPVASGGGGEAATDTGAAVAPAVERGAPAAQGAPAFAVLYPGGSIEGPPVTGSDAGSTGGLVTYVTDADPDAVIAFHRRQAESSGLASVMAMNQGDARAYGAAKDKNNLQVVASPTPEGRTSVQLSWSAAG